MPGIPASRHGIAAKSDVRATITPTIPGHDRPRHDLGRPGPWSFHGRDWPGDAAKRGLSGAIIAGAFSGSCACVYLAELAVSAGPTAGVGSGNDRAECDCRGGSDGFAQATANQSGPGATLVHHSHQAELAFASIRSIAGTAGMERGAIGVHAARR